MTGSSCRTIVSKATQSDLVCFYLYTCVKIFAHGSVRHLELGKKTRRGSFVSKTRIYPWSRNKLGKNPRWLARAQKRWVKWCSASLQPAVSDRTAVRLRARTARPRCVRCGSPGNQIRNDKRSHAQSPWLPWPPPSPPPSRTSRPAASPHIPPPRSPSPPAASGGERLLLASRPSPRPTRSSTPPTAPLPRPRARRRRGSRSTVGSTSRWPPSSGR